MNDSITKNELRIRMRLLTVAVIAAVFCAVLFAFLFFSVRNQKKKNESTENTVDTDALYSLESQNAALRAEVEALQSSTEPASGDTADSSAESVLPKETCDIEALMNELIPENLTPADPDALTYRNDLSEQYALLSKLQKQIADCPYIFSPDGELIKRADIVFEEDTEIPYKEAEGTGYDKDGNPLLREIDYEKLGYRFPVIAIGYTDFEKGTGYAYNGDTVFFSASLIKAPYLYTLLEQFAACNKVKEQNPTNDPSVGKTLSDEILEKYDFSKVIRVTESMKAEGSGVIATMDLTGGKDFTVLELMTYAIQVSDNTAFHILRELYGYDYFHTVSKRLGCASVFTSFNNLTVNDALKYLTAIYRFAQEYPTEGGLLIGMMEKANHTDIIPKALSGKATVAHKYGWDSNSYHDMALVYGDAPYGVCIMTDFDFDENDNDMNAYLRSLITTVDELHNSFYANEN